MPVSQVSFLGGKKKRRYVLTPKRKRVCKPLVRESLCSLAREALKNQEMRKVIVQYIGRDLHNEIARLCSDKV